MLGPVKLGALSVVVACACAIACGEPIPEPRMSSAPQTGDWETVVDALPFALEGAGKINRVMIGHAEVEENFANRGVVEVLFDHAEPTITVELRKFVFGDEIDAYGSEEVELAGVFERLSLWAFVTAGAPSRPELMDPADDCTKGAWKDSCAIYAYFNGKAQPLRSSVDLRVHLPVGYRGELIVRTEDNVAEESYPRRGDVTVDGLCGNGEISLQSGRARVKMCRDLVPAPTCSLEEIAACDGWPDGSGSEAWSAECGACADGSHFGRLTIEAAAPAAADVIVDAPEMAWIRASLANLEAGRPYACETQIDACASTACSPNDAGAHASSAEINPPSPAAPAGGGFRVAVTSGACSTVPFVNSPADWSRDWVPPQELRGMLRLCSGCL